MSREPKSQEINESATYRNKCRIPQRLSGRNRPPWQRPAKAIGDTSSRPKSANRAKDDAIEPTQMFGFRSARPERERLLPALKTPLTLPNKKPCNETKVHDGTSNKAGRKIITVPLNQKPNSKIPYKTANLPDQETIKKCEELELSREDYSDAAQLYSEMKEMFYEEEQESITSKSDKVMSLKNNWQKKMGRFQEMKNHLNNQQKAVMEVYASLRTTQQKLIALGQKANLPSTDDLCIMNVANMSPDQLLQLCAETTILSRKNGDQHSGKNGLTIDIKKLNELPLKLVATCEQTLASKKDFIDWFENLKNQEQCTKGTINRKICEMNAENEMLHGTLQSAKNEFLKELHDFLRTCCNETVGVQLRNEDLTHELMELKSENDDLKKQICKIEQLKSQNNKMRVEELEKQLKEEKFKSMSMRERLLRTDGQVKISDERTALLESALGQAQAKTRTLERTVQQLQEQNQKLQNGFDEELNKLKESMKKNTLHLEEIASARESLQTEKEELKIKLEELSKHYNESINSMKSEINNNVAKVIEVEKKYNDEIEDKRKLRTTIEFQCAQLLESELRLKDTVEQLRISEEKISQLLIYKHEFEKYKKIVDEKQAEVDNCQCRLLDQSETIKEIEKNSRKLEELNKHLRFDIDKKSDYIIELEKKQTLMEQELQESEFKMGSYEEQLSSLKNHIEKLQEHFGEFENLNKLNEMVNQHNLILKELTRKSDVVSEELHQKEKELNNLLETIAEQEKNIKQRRDFLEMIAKKETEHTNILELTQQISDKNDEIESLIANLEKRKQQICQLEKIILTLEDQNRRTSIQRKKDQDRINALEKKVATYEFCINKKSNRDEPIQNLDTLIKILEDELGSSFETHNIMITKNDTCDKEHSESISDYNILNHTTCNVTKISPYQPKNETKPTKIVMGNFVDKTYIQTGNEELFNSKHLNRKKAIASIETQNIHTPLSCNTNPPDFESRKYRDVPQLKKIPEKYLTKLQYYVPNYIRDEKKSKKFELASHRLA